MLTLWVAANPTFLRCKFRRAFDRRAASRTARRHLTSRELGFRGSPGTRTRTRALGATARGSRPPRKRGTILCWRFFRGCQSPLGPPPAAYLPSRRTLREALRLASRRGTMGADGKSSSVWSAEEDAELARLQVRPPSRRL